ncbi:MAG: tyrosine-type recombinase/integrase [Baekduia sp.]
MLVSETKAKGSSFALRFHAYGQRRYVTLGTEGEGWTHQKAQDELALVLAQVRLGRWQPDEAATAPVVAEDPGFHRFASEWLASVAPGLKPSTVEGYRWQITDHLLPFFAEHTLRGITVREVDRYRDHKLAESRLSKYSINKTLTRLGQILERAVEYDLIERNPVRVGRRKLDVAAVPRSYLDDAAQVADLLQAARDLDREARVDRRHVPREAFLATLAFSGLRIGEAVALRWRNVDLASGRLNVEDSKTAAGVRYVMMQPALRQALAQHRASASFTGPDDRVFATASGGPFPVENLRSRVFSAAVKRANLKREERELPPLPAKLTPHSLRRTYISALLALGMEVPVVMAEVGHADPSVTFRVYAAVMRRDQESRDLLAGLLEGRLSGSYGQWTVAADVSPLDAASSEAAEAPH